VDLILHIGAEKTGTTSIQASLYKNREALGGLGYHVANFLGEPNHKELAAYAQGPKSNDVSMTSISDRYSEKNFSEFEDSLKFKIEEFVEKRKCGTMIVSSEDLQRVPAKSLVGIKKLFSPFVDAIKIIFFVRRQDLLAVSRHTHMVRNGGYREAVFPESIGEARKFYGYEFIVNSWISAFGDPQVVIVPYGKCSVNEGKDSVLLFYEACGISFDTLEKVEIKNKSFNRVGLKARQMLDFREHHFSKEGVDEILNIVDTSFSKDPMPVSMEKAKHFYNIFLEANNRLANKYLNQANLFDDDFSMYLQKREYLSVEEELILGLMGIFLECR
jgi:hypothetical protein